MRYYISDLHFYHTGLLLGMDKRGFGDVEQMNEFMIHQWNSRVRPNDEVVILGDLSFGSGAETAQILIRLNGRKYLIEGNHDFRYLKDPEFNPALFKWIKPYAELNDNRRKICLCHYPIMCYNGQYRYDANGAPRSFMLYGHVHDTYDEVLVRNYQLSTMSKKRDIRGVNEPAPIPCNLINCFCMYSNYVPLTLEEWMAVRVDQLKAQNEINNQCTDK